MENKTTLLVTTDFSKDSITAIRFAIQFAKQTDCNVVYYHVIDRPTPAMWNNKEDADGYEKREIKRAEKKISPFVNPIYKQAKIDNPQYQSVVEMGLDVDGFIINYAQKIKADYICVSTRGAGILNKRIGTNASALVSKSPIPVFVVPHNYHVKALTKIGYASDLEHIDKELALVKDIATTFKAQTSIYHYHYYFKKTNNKELFNNIIAEYQTKDVVFHIPKLYIDYTLVENMQRTIEKEKLSILILFTKHKSNLVERFFLESKTVDMKFDVKIPLLSIRK
jgi:nucleotide-binding universal stress UspA family protein